HYPVLRLVRNVPISSRDDLHDDQPGQLDYRFCRRGFLRQLYLELDEYDHRSEVFNATISSWCRSLVGGMDPGSSFLLLWRVALGEFWYDELFQCIGHHQRHVGIDWFV